MKVFISWSGQKSGAVAEALRNWLPDLFQTLEPWMSQTDIEAGARWNNELQEQLAATSFGIICLTRENTTAPWLLFEVGALAKAVGESFVVPYLIDLSWTDVASGPLTQFQAKQANRQGTWELVKGINAALKGEGREMARLERVFDRFWPDLEKVIFNLSDSISEAMVSRSVPEMVEDILLAVRGLERRASSNTWLGGSLISRLYDPICEYSPLSSIVVRLDELTDEEKEFFRRLLLRQRNERLSRLKENAERQSTAELAETVESSTSKVAPNPNPPADG